MASIVHGGRDAIEDTPALIGVVNPNSPLVWDVRMADALIAWAEAGQPVIVTPFLLAGATALVSLAEGFAQQVAEALSGVAIAQLVKPGTPCLYRSFFTMTDMRTGAPAFGTPEGVLAVLAGAQLARRYGLPYRGGGGLASSNAVDAQAASETQAMLWATLLAGTDVVLHAAGGSRARSPRASGSSPSTSSSSSRSSGSGSGSASRTRRSRSTRLSSSAPVGSSSSPSTRWRTSRSGSR